MDASVVFCVVCQTYTYYTTEAFLWDFVHRHLRTRFSPALLGVWDCFNQQFSQPTILTVKQELKQLSHDIERTDSFYSKEFMRLKDRLFYPLGVHPAIFGMTFGYISSLYEHQKQPFNDIWDYIHPKIQKVSKGQYLSGFYADAAENAFKEPESVSLVSN